MRVLKHLFDKNKAWARRITAEHPEFFTKLSQQQTPQYLWIGCSDSRVSADQIVDLLPGEIFVHRNVANIVVHTDFNCLAVLQYAVEVLKVKHVIVCGHYGCGGVQAAMENKAHGLIDNWLRNIKDVYQRHRTRLDVMTNDREKLDRLCELNVIEQVANVCHTTIVQDAWQRGQELAVHSWIYSIENGLLKDLNHCVTGMDQIPTIYRFS